MVIPAELVPHADILARIDPSPQVRRRAQCLLTWTHCPSLAAAVALTRTSGKSLDRWRARFLNEGRDGLANRPRLGFPRKLSSADDTVLQRALSAARTWTNQQVALTDMIQANA